ncbi:MAG TPA: carboxypeptidase-like regulatory domain-containing protein [Verrucomicrobiae bacterium]|nr:carboxypeptidase-like regulatory domain-containing protein [Verrucomicrobiae bacterium]
MKRLVIIAVTALFCFEVFGAEAGHRIGGVTMEARAGTPDVTVILCDQKSGQPVLAESFLPFLQSKLSFPPKLATTQSGPRGEFVFTNVPPGEYRVVAQKWTGPFKGLFAVHGAVVHLFGTAEHVRAPSAEAEGISLSPAGNGIVTFEVEAENEGTLFVLSSQGMAADAILGFHALGTNFLNHALAVNVMPYGRTTVVGLPQGTFHAWFFANDNSPGFASETFTLGGDFLRAPKTRFIAGWSDGRKDPPARLKELADRLTAAGLRPATLLGIDESAPMGEQQARLRSFWTELGRMIEVGGGEKVAVGDLAAIIGYENLKKGGKK